MDNSIPSPLDCPFYYGHTSSHLSSSLAAATQPPAGERVDDAVAVSPCNVPPKSYKETCKSDPFNFVIHFPTPAFTPCPPPSRQISGVNTTGLLHHFDRSSVPCLLY